MGEMNKWKQVYKIFIKQISKSATLLLQSGCASPAETKPGVRALAGRLMNNRCQEERAVPGRVDEGAGSVKAGEVGGAC